jgi:hypothetical protein
MRHDIDHFRRNPAIGLSYQARLNQRILLHRTSRFAGIGRSL